jgi:hypothetical protein
MWIDFLFVFLTVLDLICSSFFSFFFFLVSVLLNEMLILFYVLVF